MGDVVQIRDYQSKRAIERAHKELEKHMASVPNKGTGIDGLVYESSMGFVAPEKDPA